MSDADLLAVVTPLTKRSRPRVEYFVSALRRLDAEQVPGAIVECGVWQGASLILARTLCPDRQCWGFDTFDGMTAPDEVDGEKALHHYKTKLTDGRKWAAVSQRVVEDNLRQLGLLDRSKVLFVVGDVKRTLFDDEEPLPDQIALLHLDTDWYGSTSAALRVLYPRLVPGGVLIIDDFGHWLGARKAVDEYFRGQPVQFERIDYTGVALVKS